MKKSKRIGLFVLVLLFVLTLAFCNHPKVKRFIDIDHCLDRGGSWHYDVNECSMTENYRGPREPID